MDTQNMADIGEMRFERLRLATFRSWPMDSHTSPSDLAEAGFFYTGTIDRVKCPFGGCVLSRWEPGDSPMREHRKHFPNCPFAQDKASTSNVSDLQTSVQESQPLQESTMDNASFLGYEARIQSFRHYPGVYQTAEQLAEAGFYYTNKNDEVKCFYCGGGLRNWDPTDLPWTEHARWFPKCEFLRRLRGAEAVEEVARRYKNKGQPQRQPSQEEVMVRYINSNDAALARQHGYSLPQIETAVRREVMRTGRSFSHPKELINAIESLTISPHGRHDDTSVKSPYPSSQNFGQNVSQIAMPPSGSGMFQTRFPSQSSSQPLGGHIGVSRGSHGQTGVNRAPPREAWSGATGMEVTEEPQASTSERSEKEELQRKVEALEEEKLCKICMDLQASTVFLDCGHLVCCEACANVVRTCPMCRQHIVKRVKIFKM